MGYYRCFKILFIFLNQGFLRIKLSGTQFFLETKQYEKHYIEIQKQDVSLRVGPGFYLDFMIFWKP